MELLAVMALITVLVALALPAISNVGGHRRLTAAGIHVTGLLSAARQHAITHNKMTALLFATDSSSQLRYRVFTMLELNPSSNAGIASTADWKQVSAWVTLPDGVIVDPLWPTSPRLGFIDSAAQGQLLPTSMALPTSLKHGPQQISSYRFLIFLPSGGLLIESASSVAQFQLVEGAVSAGSGGAVYTRPAADGSPAHYFRVTVLGATGRTKIEQP